ncbi:TetR/AcrR family transcriptional regulator [Prauserella halophila]|uniref:TetR/AcrR family transcriptional regulator n=1 Tax=Prauserella halophila TaxID=185641 RepID=A0ABP4GNK3_9PSEU|nr:TetR/AcrR family transcriptional regulator [Prauserella halophila]MCP2237217.1 transcriptional regulator, TetR family [Prauserella halophila]
MTADSSSTPRRPWRGVDAEDRRARRQEQLVEAGFTIMGTDGAAAVTMRGVCRAARLTERYFYESFTGREALLVAVLEATARDARQVLVAALENGPADTIALLRHVVDAFTAHVTADPRRGRILFVESLAAPELATRGLVLVEEFTSTIAQALRDLDFGGDVDEQDAELNSEAVFGALAYLYQLWLGDRLPIGRDRFIEHVTRVIESLARATSVDADG